MAHIFGYIVSRHCGGIVVVEGAGPYGGLFFVARGRRVLARTCSREEAELEASCAGYPRASALTSS
jgi:hypothetical protein